MKRSIFLLLLVVLFAGISTSAFADDGSFTWTFTSLDATTGYHEDGPEWKGFAFVYVTNMTSLAWTDFHFSITNGPGVKIMATPAPVMSKPLYTAVVRDEVALDYYFPLNPVLPGEGVTFTFYTDNTANKNALFGVCGYPTVPEPSSMLALSGGLIGLVGFAVRRRR